MTVGQLQERLNAGDPIQLIDVRSAGEFDEGHVPCAVNLALEQVESRVADLRKDMPVVLICQSGTRACAAGEVLSPFHRDVFVLEGGTQAWKAAGLTVVGQGRAKLPLMRQVQLIAGPMALIGSLLAIFVSPNWAWMSALVGAGFTVAGATGFCGMAQLLIRMPWNRPAVGKTPMTQN